MTYSCNQGRYRTRGRFLFTEEDRKANIQTHGRFECMSLCKNSEGGKEIMDEMRRPEDKERKKGTKADRVHHERVSWRQRSIGDQVTRDTNVSHLK
jgi:hypothetical protein